ncbi:MAG: DUF4230 domain-containing protein [Peptostreptococcaceae bacterium]
MLQKRKKNKKLSILLPILIVVMSCCYLVYKIEVKNNTYKDDTRVLNTITQVIDLNTVKYNYSNVITVKKDKSFNEIKIPFTQKSFIVKYNGVINGGIKPEDVKIVKNTGDEIYIEIEKCRILDHYIDDSNLYVYDTNSSIFNRLEIQEVLEDISKYKKEYEVKLLEEGFLDEIKTNTKSSLQNLLKDIGYKEVNITFKN